MYGVVLPPNHPGPVVFDITFADVRFPPAIPPILSAIQGVKVLNAIQSHVVPQNSQQARSLPDADKWVAPKHEEMQLIADEKVTGWTSLFILDGVIAITTIFVHALKRTLENTIERYKARWVVRGVLEIPDVHYDRLATHAPVASERSLLIMFSLTMKHHLHLKQMDIITAFPNVPLVHEVWVRFPAGYLHPSGHTFAKLDKSLYGLKQAAADWYTLQHTRMPFESDLKRSVADACFCYKVKDGFPFSFGSRGRLCIRLLGPG
mmetsp:Transcript_36555/g.70156  ORF Transcript_36555/g.70156 Transcript_36555/m.70156 type:complete len:263 (+) Transcript_36555:948-1736(+)